MFDVRIEKNIMKKISLLLPLLFALQLSAADHPELKAFPAAAEGQIRHVIVLPYMSNEDDLKVEVFVGKVIVTDTANVKRMGGSFEAK